jgi:mannose-6-phosphate isomerase-like protein (cupin superfamily)
MERTPDPISLATARELPWKPGRSAEAFVDGDLEIRFTPRPTNGPQTPHGRDEVYIVASGTGFYRADGRLTRVGAGDMCFAAAHAVHGFEDFSDDFAIWIIFYGPQK